MKKRITCFLAIWIACIHIVFSQDCEQRACLTNSLIINTGYNHQTGSAFPLIPNQQDPFWTLTSAPNDVGAVTLNGPAYMINYSNDVQPNSQFISAFNTNNANVGNLVASGRPPYSFERCFCVCSDNAQINYDFKIHVDNLVALFLEQPSMPDIPLNNPNNVSHQLQNIVTTENFEHQPEHLWGTVTVNRGRHCIRAELRNAEGQNNAITVLGLNITGTISTVGNQLQLQNETCCTNRGFIVGYKFRDENCNGRKDANENFLPNWQIQLNGNGLSQSLTTDAQGYYAFSVPSGTYTVNEVQQPGWTATTPTGGIRSGIMVTQNSITRIDFGNCPRPNEVQKFCCPGKNMVANGDFEAGNVGFTSQYVFNGSTTSNATFPGQYNIVTGASALNICAGWVVQDPSTCSNATGKFLVVNGANCGGRKKVIWQQNFTVKDWTGYKFCASAKNLKQCNFDVRPNLEVQFSMAGIGNITQTLNVNTAACDWFNFQKNIELLGYGTNLTIKILLDETIAGDGNDVAIDNIALIEVPRCPSSAAVFQVTTSPVNATDYSISATSTTTPDCDAIFWEVCEYDFGSGACVSGTFVSNPAAWWFVNTNFPGYPNMSNSSSGVFKYGKIYRISRGTWGKCHSMSLFTRYVGSSATRKKLEVFTEEEFQKNSQALLRAIR